MFYLKWFLYFNTHKVETIIIFEVNIQISQATANRGKPLALQPNIYFILFIFCYNMFLIIIIVKYENLRNHTTTVRNEINILLWLLVRLAAKRYNTYYTVFKNAVIVLLFFRTLLCISLHRLRDELNLKLQQ